MERTIKFIWDYFGEAAFKTAEHHKIHLQEFAEQKSLKLQETGVEEVGENHVVAYLLLYENEALENKEILRPHKAYIIN